MTFKQWALTVFKPEPETPEADFVAAHIRDDEGFPDTLKHLGELHTYLRHRKAYGPAIDAADRVWLAYLTHRHEHSGSEARG